MIQSIIVTPVSVDNHIIIKIQNGYPVEEQEFWEVDKKSLTDDITESNFGGAKVVEDVVGEHSCQMGLHSVDIFNAVDVITRGKDDGK